MEPLCISEIPVLNQLKHCNNPKDGKIEINNQLENVLAAAKACDCSLFIYHPDKRRRADYGTNSDVNL
jgi:hypothetical protein